MSLLRCPCFAAVFEHHHSLTQVHAESHCFAGVVYVSELSISSGDLDTMTIYIVQRQSLTAIIGEGGREGGGIDGGRDG